MMAEKVPAMTYDEYVDEATQNYLAHSEWRLGQAYFNTLVDVRPDLSEQVRSGPLDPFYSFNPDRLAQFLVFVEENW